MYITEAGIDLVLYHAPGETNDQIIVHWPEQDVLCPADNIYRAFPNLYAVRGTAARYHSMATANLNKSEDFVTNTTQGGNRRENLNATSAMMGRICPLWWG